MKLGLALAWARRIAALIARSDAPYALRKVAEVPTAAAPRTLYIVGESRCPWFAVLCCPCGCGALVQLPLLHNLTPQWRFSLHCTGTFSLEPSIRRTTGCRSHFFLHRAHIVWASRSVVPAALPLLPE